MALYIHCWALKIAFLGGIILPHKKDLKDDKTKPDMPQPQGLARQKAREPENPGEEAPALGLSCLS